MKRIIPTVLMLLIGSISYAQSTCMSRCEDAFGFGNSNCPKMCKEHPDGLKRKKTEKKTSDTSSASAAASSSSYHEETTQAADKKADATTTSPSTQPVKEKQ